MADLLCGGASRVLQRTSSGGAAGARRTSAGRAASLGGQASAPARASSGPLPALPGCASVRDRRLSAAECSPSGACGAPARRSSCCSLGRPPRRVSAASAATTAAAAAAAEAPAYEAELVAPELSSPLAPLAPADLHNDLPGKDPTVRRPRGPARRFCAQPPGPGSLRARAPFPRARGRWASARPKSALFGFGWRFDAAPRRAPARRACRCT
jgi:hypothetical protein